MSLIEKFVGRWERDHAELELDDIQATVLRERPEPYYGTHVILHFDDRGAGREFLRRITPHVRSAAEWWQGEVPWIGIGLSHAGLQRLGGAPEFAGQLPGQFPRRHGRACRAAGRRGAQCPRPVGARLP
ncbi:hypothetical protein [Luteococcus sp.]|uniref:hypothetical protein n=1 Tax=Luteococcus sp. TaxID=1969402 RepID=UPI0037368D36